MSPSGGLLGIGTAFSSAVMDDLPPVIVDAFGLISSTVPAKQSGNTNVIFQCQRHAEDGVSEETVFVRITSSTSRSRGEVEAELDLMHSMLSAGLPIAQPVRARNGIFVVPVREEDDVVAVCFKSIGGRPAERPDDLRDEVIDAWATLLAKMHLHVISTCGESSVDCALPRRSIWSEDAVIKVALNDTAPATARLSQILHSRVEWMKNLPRTRLNFGLTHADLQISNFHILKEAPAVEIAAFDFDDVCYHFFAHDVAVAVTQLRKAGLDGSVPHASALESRFLATYLEARGIGGRDESGLHSGEEARQLLEWLPRFVEYRAALVVCWASEERLRGSPVGPVGEAWLAKSLPIYVAMCSQSGS